MTLLRELERSKTTIGAPVSGSRKRQILDRLARAELPSARAVLRLHEALCFLRAYPDDARVLAQVERMLDVFAARRDLRRHRRELADSGIDGTDVRFQFFWVTARWLARRWPDRLAIDWPVFEGRSRLQKLVPLLLPQAEGAILERSLSPRAWMHRLKGPHFTDAAFLVRRFEALGAEDRVREMLYEDLDPPLVLHPGPGTPSRTRARHPGLPVYFQDRPLDRRRPSMRDEARRAPLGVFDVDEREAGALIDLARAAMVTRSRDLDAFEHADPRDVRLVDCGDGLQFACFGARPERRLLLDVNYGFLTLKNGVPIGYVLTSALFGSAAVAYNVFESFRGGESARVYGRVLGMVRHLFGCDAFSIDPYQLGHHNPEGLRSGAWWFYRKLGFEPADADARRLARSEREHMRRDPRHRSSRATLERLASKPLFFYLGRPRADVMGRVDLGNIGEHVTHRLASRFGAGRERGVHACAREAMQLLGVRTQRGWSPDERDAWRRWSPLVLCIEGVAGWTAAEKRALAGVVRAKGARRESDFALRFDRHRRLRRAVLRLAARPPGA